MKSRPLGLTSMVVLVVLAGVTVTAAVLTRNVVRSQDRLILRQRATEVASLVGGAFVGLAPSLQSLGTIARLEPRHPEQFVDAARAVSATGSFMVVARNVTGFMVTATTAHAPAAGAVISGDQEQLARRALSAKGPVLGLVRDRGPLRLDVAVGGAAGPGTVILEESPISPTRPVPLTARSPFSSLDIALYISARPDPSTLVATTTARLPLAGVTVAEPVVVGADRWLIVARSTTPLVGSLASAMPWIILALGLFIAALLTAVVETLSRRRAYASSLVAERTASLRAAIVELEDTQVQLLRQERLAAVGQLASSVGHELRNPLGVLMNVLYLIEAGAAHGGSDALGRHVATAKREVMAATLIVSDLLDYATSRGPIVATVDLCELMAEALSVVPAPAGVEVEERCDPGLVIDADRDQIRQVFLNLISNAYDAMPAGGVLTVAATAVAEGAQITVTDTGVGMDDQTREGIFTPFFSKKARGIGLGLAVTKRIMESHGGTITVASAPSAGTTFTLALPSVAAVASVPA